MIKNDPIVLKKERMHAFLKMLEQFVKEQNGNFWKECLKSGTSSYYQEHILSWEWNKNRTIEKKEQERNNLAEGPGSRTEQNNFKKVRTCPALLLLTAWNRSVLSLLDTNKKRSIFWWSFSKAEIKENINFEQHASFLV